MRIRRIAVLIDGGFFVKRLPRLVPENWCDSPEGVARCAAELCKRHVQRLTHSKNKDQGRWLDHVYRLFYYDASPYTGTAHHPLLNKQIQYAKTPEALFRNALFQDIRKRRKFALRLGKVNKEHDWQFPDTKLVKKLLQTKEFSPHLKALSAGEALPALSDNQKAQLANLSSTWSELGERDLKLGLRQKGVDMRIGVDITTLTLKKQVDTIVLVTGDSDFVPAAKVARREGVEFILDPMRQNVNEDLNEHVDGIISVFQMDQMDDELEQGR